MVFAFPIDPCDVLGVASNASFQEIREAYRSKVKRYHPDHGGDPWTFRIVHRSYEALSTARVAGHASQEQATARPASAAPTRTDPSTSGEPGRTRAGVRDKLDDVKLVDVELFLLRFEIDDPMEILLGNPADRNLSCCLNIAWPTRELATALAGQEAPEAGTILPILERTFAAMPGRTQAVSSWSQAERGRFRGWLSYPTVLQASAAFKTFHQELNAAGLGAFQWSRELFIPREDL
jgi:hypothetical protein